MNQINNLFEDGLMSARLFNAIHKNYICSYFEENNHGIWPSTSAQSTDEEKQLWRDLFNSESRLTVRYLFEHFGENKLKKWNNIGEKTFEELKKLNEKDLE